MHRFGSAVDDGVEDEAAVAAAAADASASVVQMDLAATRLAKLFAASTIFGASESVKDLPRVSVGLEADRTRAVAAAARTWKSSAVVFILVG